jgi:hypothetical protein
MAIDLRDADLRLVRERDGLSVNLRPIQGLWTEEQYLALTDHTRHLSEFTDGTIEVLPTVTDRHQVIIALLYELLTSFLRPLGRRRIPSSTPEETVLPWRVGEVQLWPTDPSRRSGSRSGGPGCLPSLCWPSQP